MLHEPMPVKAAMFAVVGAMFFAGVAVSASSFATGKEQAFAMVSQGWYNRVTGTIDPSGAGGGALNGPTGTTMQQKVAATQTRTPSAEVKGENELTISRTGEIHMTGRILAISGGEYKITSWLGTWSVKAPKVNTLMPLYTGTTVIMPFGALVQVTGTLVPGSERKITATAITYAASTQVNSSAPDHTLLKSSSKAAASSQLQAMQEKLTAPAGVVTPDLGGGGGTDTKAPQQKSVE